MATTTDITSTNIGLYTWDSVPLVWSDALSGLRTWDVSYATIQYFANVGETLSVVEGIAKSASHRESESFSFVETHARWIGLNPAEAVSIGDDSRFYVAQSLLETIGFGEMLGNSVAKLLSENLGIVDSYANLYGLNKAESMTFAENYTNKVGYIRVFAETVNFAESVGKSYSLYANETLKMLDAWRRQGDMVLSDMVFAQDDFTIEDFDNFMKYGTTPGYERWRDFAPGDYEYQQAMYRVILQSTNNDRALLRSLNAAVDVPDLIDRGSAYVTNASTGAVIVYNRVFHIIPEITMSVRSGVGTNPTVVEFSVLPTKTGFTARLRDTVTNTYVIGSFTWAAHGY